MAAEEGDKAEDLLLCSQQGPDWFAAEVAYFVAQLSVTIFCGFSCPFIFYAKIHGCALGEPSLGNLMECFPEPTYDPGGPGTPFGFL